MMLRALLSVTALFFLPALMPRGGGSGGAPITPTSFAGLQLWLDGDAGCINGSGGACANGDAVATWGDQSGNANNASQATSARRPTYATNQVNGHNCVSFASASTQWLTNAYTGEPSTVVAVFDNPSPGSAASSSPGYAILGGNSSAGIALGAYTLGNIGKLNGAATNTRFFYRATSADSSSFNPISWSVSSGHAIRVWDITGVLNDGTTISDYHGDLLAGTAALPGGDTPRPIGAHGGLTAVIGAEIFSDAIASPFNGCLAELLIYNPTLTSPQYLSLVRNYVQPRFDIQPTVVAGPYIMHSFQGQSFVDMSLYVSTSTDGINFTKTAASTINSTTGAQVTNPNVWRDNAGKIVKLNGLYWMSDSEIPGSVFPSGAFPVTHFFIASSPDLQAWTVVQTFSCVTLGIVTNVSGAGCFGDSGPGTFDGNPHIFVTASSSYASGSNLVMYEMHPTVPGDFSQPWSTPVAITGSDLSVSGGPQNPQIILISGTCHLYYKTNSTAAIKHTTSSTSGCLSGYGSSTTLFTNYEGPVLFQLPGGAWRLVVDGSIYTAGGQFYSDNADATLATQTWPALQAMTGPTDANGVAFYLQGAMIGSAP